jgi:hypothetical protein
MDHWLWTAIFIRVVWFLVARLLILMRLGLPWINLQIFFSRKSLDSTLSASAKPCTYVFSTLYTVRISISVYLFIRVVGIVPLADVMLFTWQEFRPYQACVLDLVPFTLDRLNRSGHWPEMRMPESLQVLRQTVRRNRWCRLWALVDAESSYHLYIGTRSETQGFCVL